MTAGMLASAGKFHISKDVYDHQQKKIDDARKKEYENQIKKKRAYDELHKEVQEIRDLNKEPEQWNKKQLSKMVKWYRRDGDKAMPSNIPGLRERYFATCNRGELLAPIIPQNDDIIADEDDNDEHALEGMPLTEV